jgi:hypothetical protein
VSITEVAAKRARPLQTQQIPPLHNFRSPVPSRPLPISRVPYLPRFRSPRHPFYRPARFGIPTVGSLSLQVSCDRSDTGKTATFQTVLRKPNWSDPSLDSLLTCIDGRFAARRSGLASDARAVRPTGLAEVSGAQGWVLKIVSAKRLETIFGCPDAGGASPDNARPADCDILTAPGALGTTLTAWPWRWRARSLRDKMIADEISRRAEAGRPHRARNGHETTVSRRDHHSPALEKCRASCAFSFGAGDGNRTRTISLGIKRERPLSASPCYS